jgi:RNA polymerase sigma-70 factor (ECF subfamily)
MAGEEQDEKRRLSQIDTRWSTLNAAHQHSAEQALAARGRLITRYGNAIYAYLLKCLRDPDKADELFQEFALRLSRGDFRRASPGRGRFRDFIKTSLYHLIVDYHRGQRKRGQSLTEDVSDSTSPDPASTESDAAFLASWRTELLDRAWQALKVWEQQTRQPLHTVLRCRSDHPDSSSAELAELLAKLLGKPVNAGWVRKRLYYAREKFSELLVDEVASTLALASPAQIEQELIDLDLLQYCRGALARRKT